MYAKKIQNNICFHIVRNHSCITRNVFPLLSMHVTKYCPSLFGKINKYVCSQRLKLCSEVEEALNKQICAEQQAAQDYLSIAVLLLQPNISRPGAGSYFMKMYFEELNHMKKFIQYQIIRGGIPVIQDIKKPSTLQNITLLSAFERAFIIEDNVTQLLENLVQVADSVKDYQCSDFVTSRFLREQRYTLSELAHHITKLTRFGDDEHALYHYDMHLSNSPGIHKLKAKLKET